MLTNDQKRTQIDISRHLLSRYNNDPSDFIKRDVIHDETRVHHFTRSQSADQTMEAALLNPEI